MKNPNVFVDQRIFGYANYRYPYLNTSGYLSIEILIETHLFDEIQLSMIVSNIRNQHEGFSHQQNFV